MKISYDPYDTNYVDSLESDDVVSLEPTENDHTLITMLNGEVLVSNLDAWTLAERLGEF